MPNPAYDEDDELPLSPPLLRRQNGIHPYEVPPTMPPPTPRSPSFSPAPRRQTRAEPRIKPIMGEDGPYFLLPPTQKPSLLHLRRLIKLARKNKEWLQDNALVLVVDGIKHRVPLQGRTGPRKEGSEERMYEAMDALRAISGDTNSFGGVDRLCVLKTLGCGTSRSRRIIDGYRARVVKSPPATKESPQQGTRMGKEEEVEGAPVPPPDPAMATPPASPTSD